MTGNTVNIKGVKVTTPAGVGAEGGELHKEQVALQTASDAAQQADQKYTRLCGMLPSYSNDQQGFYRVRDQMFDLLAGTTQIASAVAAQTGQSPPAPAPSVPTAASDVAAGTGIDPAKGVANPPAPAVETSTAAPSPAPTTAGSASQALSNLKSAVTKLRQVAEKKTPKKKPASNG